MHTHACMHAGPPTPPLHHLSYKHLSSLPTSSRVVHTQQLDSNMAKMMEQKRRRQEEIKADQEEINRINEMIKSHVTKNLERLDESIKAKSELRDSVAKELESQTNNIKQMEKDAAALIGSIRSKTSKLMVSWWLRRVALMMCFHL
jgi:hypothetical protein